MLHHLQNNRDNMTKKLVSELEGAELDYFVALSEGLTQVRITSDISIGIKPYCYFYDDERNFSEGDFYSPSLNWAQAGPLIDKYEIDIDHRAVENYPSGFDCGATCLGFVQYGHTALVAVCRSIVLYKIGKYVDWPSHEDKELK
jgi:hypothetical protein